jgi:iron complex transport system permease protein
MTKAGFSWWLVSLFFFAIVVLAITPFIGMSLISPFEIFENDLQREILFNLRIPRVLTAFLAGAGLSLCGMIFQAMFRNPLADPFTLGIASGASCGAAMTILAGISGAILGIPFISVGAFVGAACSMVFVYGIATLSRTVSNVGMLLAGLAVSFLFSSLLMFFQYLSSFRDSFQIVRWLMGGIEAFGYRSFFVLLPFVTIGTGIIIIKLSELDQLLTGEDIASSRGVNVRQTKSILLIAATLLVGSIVSMCGPIGFIGLMAPHICRMMFSANHRLLGPASFLFGGTFLVLCDTFARIVVAPAEIPVGVITALLGGPFFLWILLRRKEERTLFG